MCRGALQAEQCAPSLCQSVSRAVAAQPPMHALRHTNMSQASPSMQPTSPGSFARLNPEVCRLLGEIMRESRGRLRCVMLCTASAKQALAFSDSAWPGAKYG